MAINLRPSRAMQMPVAITPRTQAHRTLAVTNMIASAIRPSSFQERSNPLVPRVTWSVRLPASVPVKATLVLGRHEADNRRRPPVRPLTDK
jgi:hypothetical protein